MSVVKAAKLIQTLLLAASSPLLRRCLLEHEPSEAVLVLPEVSRREVERILDALVGKRVPEEDDVALMEYLGISIPGDTPSHNKAPILR